MNSSCVFFPFSFCRCGPLIDLCRGPHVRHTGKVKAFDVVKVGILQICYLEFEDIAGMSRSGLHNIVLVSQRWPFISGNFPPPQENSKKGRKIEQCIPTFWQLQYDNKYPIQLNTELICRNDVTINLWSLHHINSSCVFFSFFFALCRCGPLTPCVEGYLTSGIRARSRHLIVVKVGILQDLFCLWRYWMLPERLLTIVSGLTL